MLQLSLSHYPVRTTNRGLTSQHVLFILKQYRHVCVCCLSSFQRARSLEQSLVSKDLELVKASERISSLLGTVQELEEELKESSSRLAAFEVFICI